MIQEKPYLSRADAAHIAGVSILSIDRAIKRGDLRCGHIGKRVLIEAKALYDFIFPKDNSNEINS